ncbi:MAG: ATP-binding cassette domain-containing protein, partial [Microvirga sp.]
MTPIIRFQDVTKRFGTLTVLDGFNFEVRQGEKVTLIGPSGSGKST